MLRAKEKQKTIQKVARHEKDTGSSEVQLAILSEEINQLGGHLKKHPKDVHSRRGLLGMVQRRRRLLEYLKESSPRRYSAVTKKLGLKR